MSKIKTTGDLRKYLADVIVGVGNGLVETEKARNITKLAAQINESFYSEIKIKRTMMEAGKEVGRLGDVAIAEND